VLDDMIVHGDELHVVTQHQEPPRRVIRSLICTTLTYKLATG
jgi:hypothetical protein